jgi:hypothetical protein
MLTAVSSVDPVTALLALQATSKTAAKDQKAASEFISSCFASASAKGETKSVASACKHGIVPGCDACTESLRLAASSGMNSNAMD